MSNSTLAAAVTSLVDICHSASLAGGWWGTLGTAAGEDAAGLPLHVDVALVRGTTHMGKAIVAQKLCRIHSEISEAMEGHRKNLKDDKLPQRPMLEVELADAMIRICDLAGALGLDLGGALAEKLAYNAQRPYHKPDARAAEGGKAY